MSKKVGAALHAAATRPLGRWMDEVNRLFGEKRAVCVNGRSGDALA